MFIQRRLNIYLNLNKNQKNEVYVGSKGENFNENHTNFVISEKFAKLSIV